jgi:hemoglobin/transferrin/lactoferrin receptor protein
MYGKAGAKLMIKHFQVDAFVRASAAKVLSDYNLEGEDNLSYATTNGMPSWYTLNIKTQYNHFFKGTLFVIQSGIENILDTHYRLFASGISAPGRNVYVSLRISL